MRARADETIGKRELTSLFLIAIGMKLSDLTPSIMYAASKTAGWMVPIVAFAVMLVPLLALMSVLKRYQGQGLLDVIFALTGRYGGLAIGLLLFVLTLVTTAVISRGYIDIINTMVYQMTPIPILYALMMLAACYIAHLGILTVARVAWVAIPYIEFAILLLVFLVWREVEWYHLFPLAGSGWMDVLREGALHGGMFEELFLLTLIFPSVRSFKDARLSAYIGSAASTVKIAALTAVYLAVFDFPVVYNIAFPFHQLTKDAAAGQIITHMESIFLAFWLITSVIFFAIYVYLLTFLFGRTLGMKTHVSKLALPIGGLVVLLGLLPENNGQVGYIWNGLMMVGTFVFGALPLLLWCLDRWRRYRV